MSISGVQVAIELVELGAQLRAQRHRREHPEATEDEVAAVVAEWLTDRSQAPHGDSTGRPGTWPRQR